MSCPAVCDRAVPSAALSELSALLSKPATLTPAGMRFEAAALVLRNLLSLGWQTMTADGFLYVRLTTRPSHNQGLKLS